MVLSLGLPSFSAAETVVVVHPDNKNSLDAVIIRKIYLSKNKSFPNGDKVAIFDLPEGNKTRDEFRDKVLRKSASRLSSYWARMLFSSKGKPPKVLSGADEVKDMISSNPSAIAYLDARDVDSSVKVVLHVK